MNIAFGRQSTSQKATPESDAQWNDWRWQVKNMLRTEEDFAKLFALSEEEKQGIAAAPGLFRVGATPYYSSLMDKAHASCPIRMQAIPRVEELRQMPGETRDPLGEEPNTPVPGIFHKYPDRVLLMVFDRCAIYCRHCNRRRVVGGESPPTKSEVDQGIEYIAKTPQIRDVLLSGGDPLLLSTKRLVNIISRLQAIEHVDFVRIGTRVPVVLPMRIDDELCEALAQNGPVYINTHFNHAKELSPEAVAACGKLVDAGIPMGNQTVLLRGINSSKTSLENLFRGLLRARVKPYYLFQGDTVLGTDHLRTRVETAIELYGQLRGFVTGMAMPHLVIDAPGGGGKIPLLPQYLKHVGDKTVELVNYKGIPVSYPQPEAGNPTVAYDEVYFP